MADGLGASAARGAALTIAGQIARLVLQAVGLVVLARLLDPSDYGLVAMVVAVVGIGEVLRDLGLSTAAIQSPELSRQQRDNLFWLNTVIGLILMLLVVAAAPLISLLYGDDRLTPIAVVLAATLLINGLATQYRADLNRNLRFRALAIIEVVSPAIGLTVAIGMAAAGYAYWALVTQQVLLAVIGLVLSWALCRWIPRRPRRGAGTAPFLRYGGNLMGAQLLNYASRNIDSVVIGSTLGAASLGIYNRAFELVMLPLNQLQAPATKVALPILSKLQNDSERFGSFLLTGQRVLLTLLAACFALAAAQAPPLVRWVLGAQWNEVVPILQILCIGGIFQAATYATYWAFLALGLTKSNFQLALVSRPLMIVIVVAGAIIYGLPGVAIAYTAAAALNWVIGLLWIGRASGAVPVYPMMSNGIRALVVFVAAGLASWAASGLVPTRETVPAFAAGLAAFILIVTLAAIAWRQFRRDCLEFRAVFTLLASTREKRSGD